MVNEMNARVSISEQMRVCICRCCSMMLSVSGHAICANRTMLDREQEKC